MKTFVLLTTVVALAGSSLSTVAAAQARDKAPAPKSAASKPEPEPPPAPASGRIQTSEEAKRENLQGAATAPLRDLNVVRTNIPDVLTEAIADPYARPKSVRCAALIAAIRPLNDALGPDVDTPAMKEGTGSAGRGAALGVMAGAASEIIPFRGIVRMATGATAHDRMVQQAILAGSVRRAYLKGLGESKGCNPPATPSHVLAGSKPPNPPGKPRYPVR